MIECCSQSFLEPSAGVLPPWVKMGVVKAPSAPPRISCLWQHFPPLPGSSLQLFAFAAALCPLQDTRRVQLFCGFDGVGAAMMTGKVLLMCLFQTLRRGFGFGVQKLESACAVRVDLGARSRASGGCWLTVLCVLLTLQQRRG